MMSSCFSHSEDGEISLRLVLVLVKCVLADSKPTAKKKKNVHEKMKEGREVLGEQVQ